MDMDQFALNDDRIYDDQLPIFSAQYLKHNNKQICLHRMHYMPMIGTYIAHLYIPSKIPLCNDFITNFIIEGEDIEEISCYINEYEIATKKYPKNTTYATFEPFKNGFYLDALSKSEVYIIVSCKEPTISYSSYELKPDISKLLTNSIIEYREQIMHNNREGRFLIKDGLCVFSETLTNKDNKDSKDSNSKDIKIDFTNMNPHTQRFYMFLTGAHSGLSYAT